MLKQELQSDFSMLSFVFDHCAFTEICIVFGSDDPHQAQFWQSPQSLGWIDWNGIEKLKIINIIIKYDHYEPSRDINKGAVWQIPAHIRGCGYPPRGSARVFA